MKRITFLIILICTVLLSLGMITAVAQNISIIPKETMESDYYKNLIGINNNVVHYPFKTLPANFSYVAWESDIVNNNIVFNYNNTRDYVALDDPSNATRYDGIVIAKTRIKFLAEFADFRYVVAYDDNTPLAELVFTRTGGVTGRLISTYGASTKELIASSASAFPMNKWFVLKLAINTQAKTFDVYFDLENGNGEILKYKDAPFRYKDEASYNSKSTVKSMKFAFNRNLPLATADKYYLDDFELYKALLPVTIPNIAVTVDVGDLYQLPQTVSANMNDGSTKLLNVTWDSSSVDTSNIGEVVYSGIVEDYANSVKLTLEVKKRAIVSIDNINASVKKRDVYSLPSQVLATMDDGTKKNINVVWMPSVCDTTHTGIFIFNGAVQDWNGEVKLTLEVLPLSVATVGNFNIYIYKNGIDKLPSSVLVTLADGTKVYEDIVWTSSNVIFDKIGQYSITGQVEGYNLPVVADVFICEENIPVINEGFENRKENFILRLPPWTTNTPVTCIVKQDTANPNNKIGVYTGSADYATVSATNGASGIVIAQMDLKLPKVFTTFKFEVDNSDLTFPVAEVFFYNANRKIQINSATASVKSWDYAFPLDKWFNCKLIIDTNKKVYSIFVDNILIAKGVPILYAELSGIDWKVQHIRIANRSADAGFIAEFDNIKMYALNDILNTEYDSISFSADVTADLSFKTNGANDINITWASDKQQFIANDGKVTRPEWLAGDETVILTASLNKNVGCGTITATKSLTLTVKQKEATDIQAVNYAKERLVYSSFTSDPTDAIVSDLTLPLTMQYGVLVKWSSSRLDVIDELGRIIIPDLPVILTLTAEISRGMVKETKEFILTVAKIINIDAIDEIQAVRRTRIALSLPTQAVSDISLILSGNYGVMIVWDSSNLSAITKEGTLKFKTYPQNVFLTAVITKGNYREEKVFTVTVPAKIETVSGGGGGGGTKFTAIVPIPKIIKPDERNVWEFSDIENVLWAKEAISYLCDKSILAKSDDSKFEPMRNITREEFIKIVMLGFNLTDTEPTSNIIFTDVNEKDWFYPFVAKAKTSGIINGFADGSFGVGKYITRQDMAVMLYNAALFAQISMDSKRNITTFEDENNISEYAHTAIMTLNSAGMINGKENGLFMPRSYATRAEAAKLLFEIIR